MIKPLRDNKGFTLIELVMVIILLSILAAVAIPRFVDLSSDADDAAAVGVIGGLSSGVAIYYASTAAGGSAAYPADPFDTASTGPMSAVPSNSSVADIVDASTCQNLAIGKWGKNNATAPTKLYYRRKGDGDCMRWDYDSTTGTISSLATVAD